MHTHQFTCRSCIVMHLTTLTFVLQRLPLAGRA